MLLENNEVVSKSTVFALSLRAVRSQHALIMALLLDKCHKTVVLLTIWVPGLLLSGLELRKTSGECEADFVTSAKGEGNGRF